MNTLQINQKKRVNTPATSFCFVFFSLLTHFESLSDDQFKDRKSYVFTLRGARKCILEMNEQLKKNRQVLSPKRIKREIRNK